MFATVGSPFLHFLHHSFVWLNGHPTMRAYLFYINCFALGLKRIILSEESVFTIQDPLSSVVSLQGEHQRKLYKDLMDGYNPLVRPVANDSHNLTVRFGFKLRQILDVVRKQCLPSLEACRSHQCNWCRKLWHSWRRSCLGAKTLSLLHRQFCTIPE